MAYSINGKIFTDHALMDEIIYNCKIILRGIVLKNEAAANDAETTESMQESDYYISIKSGIMDLSYFPLTINLLTDYGYSLTDAQRYYNSRSLIPEEDREALLEYCCKQFLTNYVEYNDYYRMLNGQPQYAPDEEVLDKKYKITVRIWNKAKSVFEDQTRYITERNNGHKGKIYVRYKNAAGQIERKTMFLVDHAIYLNKIQVVNTNGTIDDVDVIYSEFGDTTFYRYYMGALAKDDDNMDLNLLTSLDKLEKYQLITLDSLGILPDIQQKFFKDNQENAPQYNYLNHLGSKSIDIYTARIAQNWDILHMPSCETLVEARFKELYKVNRDIYARRTNQYAYSIDSRYYSEMMMFMIVAQTFADMIVDTPEWYIRRDVFDLRTVKYFLESHGVAFYKEIPLRYQIRIVKGLNKLIKYKSTEKNIFDILEIFSVDGVTVYKYYLLKNYLYTEHREIEEGEIADPDFVMDEEYDFGDEADYEGIRDMTGAVEYDFYDETEDVDREWRLYLYDFGDEGAEFANPGSLTDKEENYKESLKIIKDAYNNVYELEFVRVPLGEQYDDYIKDQINRVKYDMMTYEDKYWDGVNTHYYVRNEHLRKDFTLDGTKYMEILYNVNMAEFNFQRQYYLGLYFNPDLNVDDIVVGMPNIKEDAEFSLRNLFIFLLACNGLMAGDLDKDGEPNIDVPIDIPTIILGKEEKPEFEAYREYDGGHPWNISTEGVPQAPTPDGWEVPDLDFKDQGETPDSWFVIDQYTEWYDFGYHYTVDYNEFLYDYDYEEVTEFSFESEADRMKEMLEPANWPFRGDTDFGHDGAEAIYRTKWTVDYDFGDEGLGTVIDETQYYDYEGLWFYTPDDFPVVGNADIVYYVASTDFKVFQVYLWDAVDEVYYLFADYSEIADPVYPYPFDIKVLLTEENYLTYLNHYVVQPDGTLLKLTMENIRDFIGKVVLLRYPWWDLIGEGSYDYDADGHHVLQDDENYDIHYDSKTGTAKRVLSNDEAVEPFDIVRERYRENIDGGETVFSGELIQESFHDWMRYYYPEMYTDLHGRIFGFNMNVDLDEVEKFVSIRHSYFQWSEDETFTLDNLGCGSFINSKKLMEMNGKNYASFASREQLYDVYETNLECYQNLMERIENVSTRDEAMTYKYVFEQLFTLPFKDSIYRLKSGDLATTYDKLLREKDVTLYNFYKQLRAERQDDVRQDMVRQVLNDVVDTLNYYISGENLKYVLSFVATNTFDALMHYIDLVVNFFKSWKVYFLDPRVVYTIEDKLGVNRASGYGDTIAELKIKLWTTDTYKPRDAVQLKPVYWFEENWDNNPNHEAEVIDLASHYVDDDIFRDRTFDGAGVGIPLGYANNELDYKYDTNSDGMVEMDGGGVDVEDHSPYFNENGGRVAVRKNIYNLDGGQTWDAIDYVDINGYNVSDPKNLLPNTTEDDIGLEKFYMVEGGGASIRHIVTRTAITKIDEYNQLSVDARISPHKNNALYCTEDGMYFADHYAKLGDIVDFNKTVKKFKDKTVKFVDDAYDTVQIYRYPHLTDQIVKEKYAEYFADAKDVLGKYANQTWTRGIHNNMDTRIDDLIAWFFEINPRDWIHVESSSGG